MEQKCFGVYVCEYTIWFMHYNCISDATVHSSLVANLFLMYMYLYKFHTHDENIHPIQRNPKVFPDFVENTWQSHVNDSIYMTCQ